jgi:hypothetical protein
VVAVGRFPQRDSPARGGSEKEGRFVTAFSVCKEGMKDIGSGVRRVGSDLIPLVPILRKGQVSDSLYSLIPTKKNCLHTLDKGVLKLIIKSLCQ